MSLHSERMLQKIINQLHNKNTLSGVHIIINNLITG